MGKKKKKPQVEETIETANAKKRKSSDKVMGSKEKTKRKQTTQPKKQL
jgi:hypothetical protein